MNIYLSTYLYLLKTKRSALPQNHCELQRSRAHVNTDIDRVADVRQYEVDKLSVQKTARHHLAERLSVFEREHHTAEVLSALRSIGNARGEAAVAPQLCAAVRAAEAVDVLDEALVEARAAAERAAGNARGEADRVAQQQSEA